MRDDGGFNLVAVIEMVRSRDKLGACFGEVQRTQQSINIEGQENRGIEENLQHNVYVCVCMNSSLIPLPYPCICTHKLINPPPYPFTHTHTLTHIYLLTLPSWVLPAGLIIKST